MHEEVSPSAERVRSGFVPKAQAVSEHPEREAPKHNVNGVLHHDVDLIFHRH